ncbi:hypothetical protein Godav_025388 [Gossypium davidsonii]|uniref:Mitochondrial import receptor subunit TOM6 homolog n=1 Tax=Gossypium davidsonii TaxID=34287 RepID=A0A7J8T8J0_GOSDV|nr:hypothetical protein [Gossypium davidsonii]
MFPGMFMRKPDKAAALKQLKVHVAMFGVWVAVVRVTPYILHYLSDEKEELKIDGLRRRKLENEKNLQVPGMFMRKPDKAAALKQLKAHVAMFGVWVAVVRVTPYILHYLSDEKEELKIEF